MIFVELLTPDENEWLAWLGVQPVPDEYEEWSVQHVSIPCGPDEQLLFTYDLLRKSIEIRWTQGSEMLVEIIREGVRRISLTFNRTTGANIRVIFSDSLVVSNVMNVRVWPSISIRDEMR